MSIHQKQNKACAKWPNGKDYDTLSHLELRIEN